MLVKRSELIRQAQAWTQGRRDRSRPLTREERERLEEVLMCLVAELPTELAQYKSVQRTLTELDLRNLRMKLVPGKSEPGVVNLLSTELLAKDDAVVSAALIKIASTLVVYEAVAKLLRLPLTAMDYFVEGYIEHGCLLGRATLLASYMLRKVNAHLYIEMAGLSGHAEVELPVGKVALSGTNELFLLAAFQQQGPAEHRADIYKRTTRAEPRGNYRVGTKTLSEESIWNLTFGATGVRHYQIEVPRSPDRRSRGSVRRQKATGNAYLQ